MRLAPNNACVGHMDHCAGEVMRGLEPDGVFRAASQPGRPRKTMVCPTEERQRLNQCWEFAAKFFARREDLRVQERHRLKPQRRRRRASRAVTCCSKSRARFVLAMNPAQIHFAVHRHLRGCDAP
jgi:hypothetical protein